MRKAILVTLGVSFICLTTGLVFFRLDAVIALFKEFYTHFSWGMILTVLVTGICAGFNVHRAWCALRKNKNKKVE